MAVKLLTIIFTLYLSGVDSLQTVNGKIKISVVTTSGCSDTVNFITTQLTPAYNQYKQHLDVEFIPWGRTTRGPDGNLICQFGVNDCWANRVQRCALNLLKDNPDGQVNYMNCEFSSPYPAYGQGSYQCALSNGLNLIDLDYCVNTSGAVLDSASESAAEAAMASINFVPAIIFNEQININDHNEARIRLSAMICLALADDPSTGVTDCVIG